MKKFVMAASLLVPFVTTAGCVTLDDGGNPTLGCGFDHTCDAPDGGPAPIPSLVVRTEDGRPIAAGGTARIVVTTSDLTVRSISASDGASVSPAGTDTYALTTAAAAEGVEIIATGTDDGGELVTVGYTLPTFAVSRVTLTAQQAQGYQLRDPGPAALHIDDDLRLTVVPWDAADQALTDRSMQLGVGTTAGVGMPAFDEIELPATVGTYHVVIAARSYDDVTADLDVVDAIDRVEATWVDANVVCFHALAGEREVTAPAWTLSIDGTAVTSAPRGRNCVDLTLAGVALTETSSITGAALDHTASVGVAAPI